MESLLSLAFDNLSSRDGGKIRKGLRQVEGLLAQICLSKNRISAAETRRSIASPTSPSCAPKDLASLKEDPAFREFFKLQEGFEWNRRLALLCCDVANHEYSGHQADILLGPVAWKGEQYV
jgi:hypothetical protein